MGDPSEVTNCPEGSRPCVLELGLQHGPAAHGRPRNAATEHSHGRARGPPAWPGPPEPPLRASTAEVPAARSRHGGYDTVASAATESSLCSTSVLLNLSITNVILKPGHTARTPSRWESTIPYNCTCVCLCVRVTVHVCACEPGYVCVRTRVHEPMYADVCAPVWPRVSACTCACVCMCMRCL